MDALSINPANDDLKTVDSVPAEPVVTDAKPETVDSVPAEPVIADAKLATSSHPLQEFIYKENGIDALIICGENPKKAVICFSSMNPGKYERWSWFYEKQKAGSEDLYVILKDDEHRYYIGTDKIAMHVRHHKFISNLLSKHQLTNNDLYMVGSSMGGYAAIYFGFWMNAAGIISMNPQIDFQSTRRHTLQNWERKISEVGSNWVDLNDFVYRHPAKPHIYIEHGDYPADVSAVQKLVSSLDDLRISYTRSYVDGDHSSTSMTRQKLFHIIDFWQK